MAHTCLLSVNRLFPSKFVRNSYLKVPLMMPYTEQYLKDKLSKELDATYVEVVDLTDGCGGKFNCLVVSSQFEGKATLARHRLVNSVLKEELKEIHAFSQKTLTPDQWEKEKGGQ